MNGNVQSYLRDRGVRPSVQRIAIMNYLMTHRTHPTADEIFGALSPNMPTLSKTTVYNTLNLLAAHKAVLVLDIDARQTRFDGDTSLHAHFLCKSCGAIHDLPIPEKLGHELAETSTMHIEDIQLLYKGFCNNCNKTEK